MRTGGLTMEKSIRAADTGKPKRRRLHYSKAGHANRSLGGNLCMGLFLALMAVFMLFPLIYTVCNAFKPLSELFLFPPRFFVRNPTLQNFIDLGNLAASSWVPFSRYLFNTVFITVVGTAGHLIMASMCAYALAKREFRGKNVLFTLVVFSLMFNAAVTTIPNFMIVSWLGLIDTIWALIIPAFGSSLGLYLMKQFMEQLPDTLLEAAEIDGAGEWMKFWRIAMPNVKSAWLTLTVFSVQSLWNISVTNFVYKEELKPLGVAFTQAVAAGTISRAGVSAAVTVVMMSVPIVVFLCTQSRIIETMTASGIKE